MISTLSLQEVTEKSELAASFEIQLAADYDLRFHVQERAYISLPCT